MRDPLAQDTRPAISSEIKAKIFTKIINGQIDEEIIRLLCPNGKALDTETSLFDFKRELPMLPHERQPSGNEKASYNHKMYELVKDAVAFHNSFGGYILAGVDDGSREIVGFTENFACDQLNQKIASVTDSVIECTFQRIMLVLSGIATTMGVLHIPRRGDSSSPVKFKKDTPSATILDKSFTRNQVYFRDRDQSRAACTMEDYEFILSKNRRYVAHSPQLHDTATLHNNLPIRDPTYVDFIGRDSYLEQLWRWFFDKFNRTKVLTGLGGIGKTSIARKFSDDLIKNATLGIDAVIWLSAKKRTFSAIQGRYVDTTRLDFTDRLSLYARLLGEVGCPDADIDAHNDIDYLVGLLIEYFSQFPCFVVIDDLDSLTTEEQRYIFQEVNTIASHVHSVARNETRFLITARLELGASPAQLIKVTGMELADFFEYVKGVAHAIDLGLNLDPQSKIMRKFHQVASGSPMFANSILRFVSLGEPLDKVLNDWKGADGNEVREAAFGRELDQLSDTAIRTLFAACQLAETSFVELLEVTECKQARLREDIESLKNFHFLSVTDSVRSRSMRLAVPNNVRLMDALIRQKIADPKRIEHACAQARTNVPALKAGVGAIINRVVAHWKEEEADFALEVCEHEKRRFGEHPDFRCIFGRAYLRVTPPRAAEADKEFHKALDLGCDRPELFDLWIEAKEILEDWNGVIEVAQLSDKRKESAQNVVLRARAFLELGNLNWANGRYDGAAQRYLEGAENVNRAFISNKAVGRVDELRDLQKELIGKYIDVCESMFEDPNHYLYVWHAVYKAFEIQAISLPLISMGCRKLVSWWDTVESRGKYDIASAKTLEVEVDKKLLKVLWWVKNLAEPPLSLCRQLEESINSLRNRVESYKEHCI